MYTGYFAKLKCYSNNDLIPVSISSIAPKWYYKGEYKILAPWPKLIRAYKRKEITKEDYIIQFNKYLYNLDQEQILIQLNDIFGDLNKIILICYEKPDDFCHRHLVANWLNIYITNMVEEFIC